MEELEFELEFKPKGLGSRNHAFNHYSVLPL